MSESSSNRKEVKRMKTIKVRKIGSIRLTAACRCPYSAFNL